MTDAIAKTGSNLPELAHKPIEITAEDVALPRMKIGQFVSSFVQDKLVSPGAFFTSLGAEDPDPVEIEGSDDGVLFHVLDMHKGKSASVDGELTLYDYNDPDAPEDAWTTYNYVVVLPEAEEDFPVKWLLSRTGRPAAQQINLVLTKTAAQGPPWNQAFRVKAVERSNPKGKFFVPQVRHVEAAEGNIEKCNELATMISPDSAAAQGTGEDPAI